MQKRKIEKIKCKMRKKKKSKEAKNYTQALREKRSENFLTFVLQ